METSSSRVHRGALGDVASIFSLRSELSPLMHAKGYKFQATLCNMRILECRCNCESSALE